MIFFVFNVFDCTFAKLELLSPPRASSAFLNELRSPLTSCIKQRETDRLQPTTTWHYSWQNYDELWLKLLSKLTTILLKLQQTHLTASTLYWRHFIHSEKSFSSCILPPFVFCTLCLFHCKCFILQANSIPPVYLNNFNFELLHLCCWSFEGYIIWFHLNALTLSSVTQVALRKRYYFVLLV